MEAVGRGQKLCLRRCDEGMVVIMITILEEGETRV